MKPISDTIAAIATPIGEGGISVIRISGAKSLSIALGLFDFFDGTRGNDLIAQRVYFGNIKDPQSGEGIDQVILTWFRSPKSYTQEDVVEISVHGGIYVTSRVLQLILNRGARLAEPGEFTRRAFLNGRIDLSQAEAVADLIQAVSDKSLKSALAQLQGALSKKLIGFYDQLISILAQLETAIDFPEEGLEFEAKSKILEQSNQLIKKLGSLIETYSEGKIFREGARIILIGKPNVGKSSLLNILLEDDRAIVTAFPGTTRDVLEEKIRIKDIHVHLTDSAGLRTNPEPIEEQGINKTLSALSQADLVLALFDGSQALDSNDEILIKEVKDKPCIILINKSDLPEKLDVNLLGLNNQQTMRISAKNQTGIKELLNTIYDRITQGKLSREPVVVTRERHLRLLIEARGALLKTSQSIEENLSEEFIAADLNDALEALGKILGKTIEDDLLEKIFSEFCIGK